MLTGKVDKNWANQHHNKWYEEVAGQRDTGSAGGRAPQAAPAAREP
jgi:cytochrome b subunit of formate dehydrogenase